MPKTLTFALLTLLTATGMAVAAVPVGMIVNPYAGDRAGPEIDSHAQAMARGLKDVMIGPDGFSRRPPPARPTPR